MDRNIVVITGAATGFGRLTAELLARSGHTVYAGMRDVRRENRADVLALQALRRDEGIDIHAIELNVLQEESCRAAADLVLAQQGRVDVVINNAAILVVGLTEAFRAEQFLEVFNTNAVGWVRVNQAFLPIMRRQRSGLVVSISSSTARMVDPFIGPYAASKAAADVLAETMHYENSQFGIDGVIVMPGAYPSGTALLHNATAAADEAVTAQYDRIASLPAELPQRLVAMQGPEVRTDPAEVAQAIVGVIAMTPGGRPRRIVVDPQRRGIEEINALHERLQRRSFERLGIDHLIDTSIT